MKRFFTLFAIFLICNISHAADVRNSGDGTLTSGGTNFSYVSFGFNDRRCVEMKDGTPTSSVNYPDWLCADSQSSKFQVLQECKNWVDRNNEYSFWKGNEACMCGLAIGGKDVGVKTWKTVRHPIQTAES